MIGLTIALLVVRIEAPLTSPGDACELGRLAIEDLRPVHAGATYVEVAPKRSELLKLCPELRRYLPKGIAAADVNARSCASGKVTAIRCHGVHSGVYLIDRPRTIAGPDHAAVEVWFQCGGACGRGYIIFFVRTAQGWRRDGKTVPIAVS